MNSAYHHQLEASFFVIGSDLSPSEITAQLGIEPQHAFLKGEPRLNAKGVQVGVHPKNLWGLNSPSLPNEPYIEAHLSRILDAVEAHASFLLALTEKAELFLEIRCSLDERFKSTSYVIEQSLLARLTKLKVNVGVVFRVAQNEHS